jgi:hypothetical protein
MAQKRLEAFHHLLAVRQGGSRSEQLIVSSSAGAIKVASVSAFAMPETMKTP